jgi:hypothetical protein
MTENFIGYDLCKKQDNMKESQNEDKKSVNLV